MECRAGVWTVSTSARASRSGGYRLLSGGTAASRGVRLSPARRGADGLLSADANDGQDVSQPELVAQLRGGRGEA